MSRIHTDTTPQLLDPLGPWNIESVLKLPSCSSRLNFSTAHDRANISIVHVLKIMLRVERGDDNFVDSRGKRKVSRVGSIGCPATHVCTSCLAVGRNYRVSDSYSLVPLHAKHASCIFSINIVSDDQRNAALAPV